VRLGLEALVDQAARRRLKALRGRIPSLKAPPRRWGLGPVILVDTSVWVEYFRGTDRAATLDESLEQGDLLLHPWVGIATR
jgi:hypothetical protein